MKRVLVSLGILTLAATLANSANAETIRACGDEGKGVGEVVSIDFGPAGKPRIKKLPTHGQFQEVGPNTYLYTYLDGQRTNLLAIEASPPRLVSKAQAKDMATVLGVSQVREVTWKNCS